MKVDQQIKNLKPYQPGKPIAETKKEFGLETVIKLASNENPLGPSPLARASLNSVVDEDFSRYPDGAAIELKTALKDSLQLPPEYISLGNGSNELIHLLIQIFCEPSAGLLMSQSAFIAYKVCGIANRAQIFEIPHLSDLQTDLEGFLSELRRSSKIRIVFLANPNNPTGSYLNHRTLKNFLSEVSKLSDALVVLDEAYLEYVRDSDSVRSLALLQEFPNLVILRTFSKIYGLAGLRIGYAIARPEIIQFLEKVRNPFNVNALAQRAALAALGDHEFVEHSQAMTWQGLDSYYRELKALGLKVYPSQGNFVLVDCSSPAKPFFDQLLTRGIIVRPVDNYGLPNHLRISVGLPSENQALVRSLKDLLKR